MSFGQTVFDENSRSLLKMMKAALAGKALEGRCNIVFQKYKAGTDYVKKFWIKFAFLFFNVHHFRAMKNVDSVK